MSGAPTLDEAMDKLAVTVLRVKRERDDLLAALERILKHFEEAVILAGNDPDANPSVLQARAALAKAKGE